MCYFFLRFLQGEKGKEIRGMCCRDVLASFHHFVTPVDTPAAFSPTDMWKHQRRKILHTAGMPWTFFFLTEWVYILFSHFSTVSSLLCFNIRDWLLVNLLLRLRNESISVEVCVIDDDPGDQGSIEFFCETTFSRSFVIANSPSDL